MFKKIAFVLLALVMLGVIAFIYIEKVLLPVQVKGLIETKAKEYLNRDFSVGSIHLKPFTSLSLNDITIAEKNGGSKAFIKIKSISANISLIGLIKDRRIIISSLRIKNPFFNISREDTSVWNFSDIIDNHKKPSPPEASTVVEQKPATSHKPQATTDKSLDIILRRFIIENGQLDFTDKTHTDVFFETFRSINLDATLNNPTDLKYTLKIEIPSRDGIVSTDGHINPQNFSAEGALTLTKIPIAEYVSLLIPQDKAMLSDGRIPSAQFNFSINKKVVTAKGQLTLNSFFIEKDKQKFAGDLDLKDASLTMGDGPTRFSGEIGLNNFHFTNDTLDLKTTTTANVKMLSLNLPSATLEADIDANNISFTAPDKSFNGKISAKNLSLTLKDGGFLARGDYTIAVDNLDIASKTKVKGYFTARETSVSKDADLINIASNITLSDGDLQFPDGRYFKGNLNLQATKISLRADKKSIETNIDAKNAVINLGNNQNIVADFTAQGTTVDIDGDLLAINTPIQFKGAQIALNKEITFKGSPTLSIDLHTNLADSSALTYAINLNTADGEMTGVPQLETIKYIAGNATIKPDNIDIAKLSFWTQGTALTMSGLVNDFKNLFLDIDVASDDIDLANLVKILPADTLAKLNTEASGHSSLKMHFKGRASDPMSASIDAEGSLKDVNLTLKSLPKPVTALNGQVGMKGQTLLWKNLSADYDGQHYASNGELTDLKQPAIKAAISSADFAIDSDIKIVDKNISINTLKGNYMSIDFDVTGSADISNADDPNLTIKGKVSIDTKNVPRLIEKFAPTMMETFTKINPVGSLDLTLALSGPIKRWKDCDINLSAYSKRLSVFDYVAQNVHTDFLIKNNRLNQGDINAEIYGGKLKITSTGDLRDPNILIDARLELTEFDLATFREEKKLDVKDLAGKVASIVNVSGPILKKENLKGDGSIALTEGNIGKLGFFQGILNLLLTKEVKEGAFHDGQINFTIGNNRATLTNAVLQGDAVTLNATGWIDFDTNVDIDVVPTFSEIARIQSDSIQKGTTAILQDLVSVKIGGTLAKPTYHPNSSAIKVLQKTGDVIKGTLETIIEGVF